MMDTRTDFSTIEDALNLQFSQLSQIDNGFHGFSIEALRLLIQMKKNRHLEKTKPYFNCWAIELTTKVDGGIDFASFFQTLNQIPAESTTRIQFIIKNGGHFTAFDVKLTPLQNECLILDAMGDLRGHMLNINASEFKKPDGSYFFDRVYIGIADDNKCVLQKDSFSCPVLAYDHACQAAKIDNLYEQLAQLADSNAIDRIKTISWFNMPVRLVWNTQAKAFTKFYLKQHPEDAASFDLRKRFSHLHLRQTSHSLATELLFSKYQQQYNHLQMQLNYESLLLFLVSASQQLTYSPSFSEKLMFIVHAHEYWLCVSSKEKLPSHIINMQAMYNSQNFIEEAKKSSGARFSLFKTKPVKQFYKALQQGDVEKIDVYYQEAKAYSLLHKQS